MGISLPDKTLIKQSVNQDLRCEKGVLQLTERWKGRYLHCQDVLKKLYSVNDVYYGTFTANAGTLCAAYDTPTLSGWTWQFSQGTVDECDAGENGILQTIWNITTGEAPPTPADWPVQETWSLQWQPENYDVYAYCANPLIHDNSAGNPKSQRVAVEQCLHPPLGNNVMTMNQLFSTNNGVIQQLNDHEKKILNWKLEGKKVIKHHPVVTQQKTWQHVPYAQLNSLIAQKKSEVKEPDKVSTPSENFGLTSYTWVSQGSNLQTTQPDASKNDYTIQLQTQWIGALSVVQEFYSANDNIRWQFGKE